jgi:acylpyruvate hydrolase
MRLASISHDGRPLAVVIDRDQAVPLRGVSELGPQTLIAALEKADPDYDGALPLDSVTFRPVVPQPAKVICIGLNYRAHIQETGNKEHEYPVLFPKWASTLTGAYSPIPKPSESSAVDYEVELAVVIGRPARRVAKEAALDHVAGYTVANDITMRDYQYRTTQYLQGKAWDSTTPVGPWLLTPDEIPDLSGLTLRTLVNGQKVQESSTELMIFDVATLISTISEFMALAPGDLILTCTPSGVGFRREPQLLLGDGDIVVSEIDGIGRLENAIVEER